MPKVVRITLDKNEFEHLVKGLVAMAKGGDGETYVEVLLDDIGADVIQQVATAAYKSFKDAEVGPGQQAYAAITTGEGYGIVYNRAEKLLDERVAQGKTDGILIVLAALLAGRTEPIERPYLFEKMLMLSMLSRDGLLLNLLDGFGLERLVDALENHSNTPLDHLATKSHNWRA